MFLTAEDDQSSFEEYISVSPSPNMDSLPVQAVMQQSSPEQLEQISASAFSNGNDIEILQIPQHSYGGQYLQLPSMSVSSSGSDQVPYETSVTLPDMSSQG
jgi:hypothetical protein